MAISVDRHVDEETAEKYAMGQLSARKVAAVEEHLLLCESCRKVVADMDSYVAAMQKGAAKVRKSQGERKSKRHSAAR